MEMENTGQFGRDQLFDETNESKQIHENLLLSAGASDGAGDINYAESHDDIHDTVEAGAAINRM